MKACMGGWCRIRNRCQHYAATSEPDPAERLCVPGHDGFGAEQAIRRVRPAGTWEKSAARWMVKAEPFDSLGAA